ncbi:MAG: glycosyltransferase family 4 protein [Conexivisphaerales archaeon]
MVEGISLAIVTPSFYPMIGGIEAYVRGMSRQFVKQGFRVDIYTPDSVLNRKLEPKEETIDGVHIHRLPVALDLSYRLKLWPTLYSALAARGHDIVHVYSHDLYSISALFAAKKNSTPLILTTYGPFNTHADYGSVKLTMFNMYDGLITPVIFRAAQLILVRYPELVGWVRSYGIADGRVDVEPSGMPAGYLVPGDGDRLKRMFGRSPVLLYVGRISRQKGLHHLVMAMKEIVSFSHDAVLVMVGPDYTGYSAYLGELAARIGVSRNIIFHRPITDEAEERDMFASCDIMLMPSSFEGFSQAVLKAMAQAKPVVVTNVGGLPYEVGYGDCGLIIPFANHKAIADAVITLLQSEDLRYKMGEAGRRRASLFTFEYLAERLASEYKRIMN